jgi:photosystem II stability/assembly factor-like uncharacterized protein
MRSKNLNSGRRVSLLFLFAWFVNIGLINAQWKTEEKVVSSNLNGLFMQSSTTGWIVGDDGTILKKTATGWAEVQSPTHENLYSVVIVEGGAGWAVGACGTIVRFDGSTWKTFDSPTAYNLYSVSFKDAGNGVAVGDFGTILNFKDEKWSVAKSGMRGRLFAVSSEKEGTWVGGGLECVKIPLVKIDIENKAETILDRYDSHSTVNSLMFQSRNNGWAVGSPGVILHFDGHQWERVDAEEKHPTLTSVYFADENDGISTGYGGTLLIYSGGKWLKEVTGTRNNLNACFKAGNTWYAIGDNGTIISNARDRVKSLKVPAVQNIGEIKVFPDPCDDVLNILLPPGSEELPVSFSISGINGQVLIQERLSSFQGSGALQVSTSRLKDGFYILKVVTDKRATTARFIVKH